MEMWLADPAFFHGYGQGGRQLVELLSAFGLTALIGLEREIQGKRGGLRTQAIVGTVGFGPVARRLTSQLGGTVQLEITYQDERAVLRQLLSVCEHHGWQVTSVATGPVSAGAAAAPAEPGDVAVAMTVSGRGVLRVTRVPAMVEGVSSVKQLDDALE